MAAERADISEVVTSIYDAALNPDAWQRVVGELTRHFRANSGVLTYVDHGETEDIRFVYQNLDPDLLESYRTVQYRHDLRLRLLQVRPEGYVSASHLFMTDSELQRQAFYGEYLRPQNLFYSAGGSVRNSRECLVYYAVQRPKRREPFTFDDLQVMRDLQPHLTRAIRLNEQLAEQHSGHWAATALLERLSFGVVLLNDQGRVTYANQRAEALFARHDGLTVRRGELLAEVSQETQYLRGLVHAALQGALNPAEWGGAMAVTRSRKSIPLHLCVVPMHQAQLDALTLVPHVAAAIFISDPGARVPISGDVLSGLFGLTPAEARVTAALAEGLDLEEISARFELSKQTVRTQLKAVFNKTNTRRQTDLVRLVLSSPARVQRKPRVDGVTPELPGGEPAD